MKDIIDKSPVTQVEKLTPESGNASNSIKLGSESIENQQLQKAPIERISAPTIKVSLLM
jgi:hypothetical protein